MKYLLLIFLLLACSEEPITDSLPKADGEILVWTNSPNPFSDSTKIKFYTPEYRSIIVIITDENEDFVEAIHSGYTNEGTYEYWIGSNFCSGIYYFRVISGSFIKKITMNKL